VDLGLENKVVVITGSSQGIGRALADSYAQERAAVVLVARQEPAETIALIKDKCRSFSVEIADVTKEDQIRTVVDNVLRKYGRIDILVNNAGALREGFISETSEELWDFIFSTNLKSVFFSRRRLLPR
jgi:NAD(P)-dependent dehydrogenase (short-subunit alcohol dehydrogenase family)